MIHIEQVEPDRDRWGNPFVDGVKYNRPSSAAKPVEDQKALINWARRDGGKRVATDPALAAAVRAAEDDRAIDTVLRPSTSAADHGTLIHEDLHRVLVDGAEARETETLEALELLESNGLRPVASEVFVACREAPYAGTCDLVVEKGGEFYICDLKTTSPKPYPVERYAGGGWAAQCAVYSRSDPYCRDEGWMYWDDWNVQINRERAAVLLITRGGSEPGRLITVDLEVGWRAALLSLEVLAIRQDMTKAAVR